MIHAVIGDVDPGRVRAEDPDELVPRRLGGDDDPGGAADRRADGGLEEGGGYAGVQFWIGEEGEVVYRHRAGHAGAQWDRVVRRMDHSRADLLRDEGQPALFPGEPRRPVRDGCRPRDDARIGRELAVPLLVRALAGN